MRTPYQIFRDAGVEYNAASFAASYAWRVTRRVSRLFRCERCLAEPGSPCKTKSGNTASDVHSSRWSKAAKLMADVAEEKAP